MLATTLGDVESFESMIKFIVLDLLVPFKDLIFFQTMEKSETHDTKFFQFAALLFLTKNLIHALHFF